MDHNLFSIALTICLVGSSAASYAFGLLSGKKKTADLESTLNAILEDPDSYQNARNRHRLRSKPSF